jgi:hypothetical protein
MFTAAQSREMLGVAEALAKVERDVNAKIPQILDYIGHKTIEYLRSFTSERRPPYYGGGPDRAAHPGHWADRSGQLAASYSHTVSPSGAGWTLTLMNGAEYAAALELREGFFVLGGVTERGGPVEEALRAAVGVVAPGWSVVRYG